MTSPGMIGNAVPAGEDWLVRRVQDLERQVRELQAAPTLSAATISQGLLRIRDGGGLEVIDPNSGNIVFYVGTAGFNSAPSGGQTQQMVMYLYRDDGTVALQMADLNATPGHTHQQAWQMFDRSNNVVFADDTNSGTGLARPYIPAGTWADLNASNTTTSTSFTALQWADSFMQHPYLSANILVQTPAGVTSQIRMTVAGVQVGSVVTVPASTFSNIYLGPALWPSYVHESRATVQLEGRVASGTGTIGARGLGLWGIQSP